MRHWEHIDAVAVDRYSLYVGGSFSTVGGRTRSNLASFDLRSGLLTNWAPLQTNVVHSLLPVYGRLFVGSATGSFPDATALAVYPALPILAIAKDVVGQYILRIERDERSSCTLEASTDLVRWETIKSFGSGVPGRMIETKLEMPEMRQFIRVRELP